MRTTTASYMAPSPNQVRARRYTEQLRDLGADAVVSAASNGRDVTVTIPYVELERIIERLAAA